MLSSSIRNINTSIQRRTFIPLLKPLITSAISHALFNKEIVSASNVEYSSDEAISNPKTTNVEGDKNKLYPDHIPLNCLGKNMVFVKSAIGSFFKPYDNININQLGETIPIWTDFWLDYSYKMLLKDTEFDGRDIIMEEPDYRHILKKEYLYVLEDPEKYGNTLAYQMLKYLEKNKITLESRENVHYIDDVNHAMIYNKYRQSHDFHHLIIGDLPTSIEGEIIIKMFEGVNMGLPLGLVGGLISPLHLKDSYIIKQLYSHYLPIIIDLNNKLKCNFLLIDWSKYLLMDLKDIRYKLGGEELVEFADWIGKDVRQLKKMRRDVKKLLEEEYQNQV